MPIPAITPPALSLPALQPNLAAATTGGNGLAERADKSPRLQVAPRAEATAPAAPEGAESTVVTLSPASTAMAKVTAPAPVFAEIWKGGVKVAIVSSDGTVSSLNGFLAPSPMGNGNGGPQLAAQRAAQIAQAVGGEVRMAGQFTDAATLNMRARLQAAYGV